MYTQNTTLEKKHEEIIRTQSIIDDNFMQIAK